jgi:predicted nucleotidyltransferase
MSEQATIPPGAIRAALDTTPGLVSAYVFGSTAEARTHRQSDVDIALLVGRTIYPGAADRFDLRLRLIGRLQAALGREVDLVILNDAPPQLGRHIMTRGQRLLVVSPELDHAHLRLTLSRAADLEPFLRRMRALKLRAVAR